MSRPIHKFVITIEPDPDMGLDDPLTVKNLVEEAIRDTGIDNSSHIVVELIRPEQPTKAGS